MIGVISCTGGYLAWSWMSSKTAAVTEASPGEMDRAELTAADRGPASAAEAKEVRPASKPEGPARVIPSQVCVSPVSIVPADVATQTIAQAQIIRIAEDALVLRLHGGSVCSFPFVGSTLSLEATGAEVQPAHELEMPTTRSALGAGGGISASDLAEKFRQEGEHTFVVDRNTLRTLVAMGGDAVSNIDTSLRPDDGRLVLGEQTGILGYLGFQPGDVVQSITGDELQDANELIAELDNLAENRSFAVGVKRGDQAFQLKFRASDQD